MTIRNILTAVIAGLIAGSAGAATLKDGPHLGWAQGGDVRNDDIAAGWQVAYEFNDFFSLDLTLTRQNDELSSEELDAPAFPPESRIDLEIYAFALTGRAAFSPIRRVWIYGGAGAGYYFFNEEAEDVRVELDADSTPGPNGGQVTGFNADIDKDFGFHLAAGIEILLSETWEIFAEYRWVDFNTDATVRTVETLPIADIGKSMPTTRAPADFDYDYGLARVGINYRF